MTANTSAPSGSSSIADSSPNTMIDPSTTAADREAAKKIIRKRKYSRAGCEECKRRKMKCDETKPFCHNCSRLGKNCVYNNKKKYTFENGGTTANSDSMDSKPVISNQVHSPGSRSSIPSLHSPNTTSSNIHTRSAPNGSFSASNGSIDPFSVRHYLPGGYLNNFVTDPNGGYTHVGTNGNNISSISKPPMADSPQMATSPQPYSQLPKPYDITSQSSIAKPENGSESAKSSQSKLNLEPGHQESSHLHSAQGRGQSPSRSFTNAISDILTPADSNDYVLNQNDFLEMKHLFDEASLLVSDMNDLQSFDLLNFNANYDSPHIHGRLNSSLDSSIANPLVERKLKEMSKSPGSRGESISQQENQSPYQINSNYDGKPRTSSVNTPLHHSGSISGSDSGMKSVSDSFERHNFRVDEFSKGFTDGSINGNYLREYDVNSPMNVSHLQHNTISVITNAELIEQIIKQHNLSGPHANYLRYLNSEAVSYALFPFASSVDNNEVVHVLLKYSNNCPYLLSALLAMITTIEFNITGKPIHEVSGQKYVSVCLKSLSQAFVNNSPNKVNQFLNDIERLLLTVIILTSYFSSKTFRDKDNVLNSWKTHLRGAKDLLINYSLTTKNQSRLNVSGGLALARTWFFAIEALASLTTPLGGTLTRVRNKPHGQKDNNETKEKQKEQTKDDEQEDSAKGTHIKFEKSHSIGAMSVDTDEASNDSNNRVFTDTGYFDKEHNPEYHDALFNNGLLTSVNPNFNYNNYKGRGKEDQRISEFNLFLGFTMEMVYLVQEFAKSLEMLRVMNATRNPSDAKPIQLPSIRISRLSSLIYNAQMAIIAPLVDLKTFIIPEASPAHPNFPKIDPDRIELPDSAYGKLLTHENTYIYYSWFDMSQQCHCDAIYLRMLITTGMLPVPKDHPIIKDLVTKILDCLFFIGPKTTETLAPRETKIMAETKNYFISSDLFDHRAFMIQSPYRLVTPLVDDEDTFEKLELFFLGLVKLGNGSATGGLDGLNKRREAVKKRAHRSKDRKESFEKDEDNAVEFNDDSDDKDEMSLAQTEIVPFS